MNARRIKWLVIITNTIVFAVLITNLLVNVGAGNYNNSDGIVEVLIALNLAGLQIANYVFVGYIVFGYLISIALILLLFSMVEGRNKT